MINVHASMADLTLRMEGHANAERNEHDHDLVCCAASILLQTLVRSCALYTGITVAGEADMGRADIRLECVKGAREAAIHRFVMVMDGLEMLAKTYPQSIHITHV
jgi:uncharacterized protein YsxB (DUF464 family)